MARLEFEEVKVFDSSRLSVTFRLAENGVSIGDSGYGEGVPITVVVAKQPLDQAVAEAKLVIGKLGADLAEKVNHP